MQEQPFGYEDQRPLPPKKQRTRIVVDPSLGTSTNTEDKELKRMIGILIILIIVVFFTVFINIVITLMKPGCKCPPMMMPPLPQLSQPYLY